MTDVPRHGGGLVTAVTGRMSVEGRSAVVMRWPHGAGGATVGATFYPWKANTPAPPATWSPRNPRPTGRRFPRQVPASSRGGSPGPGRSDFGVSVITSPQQVGQPAAR